MEHSEITEKIIGCAYRVYNQMGAGFLESVYENCMKIELKKLGLHFQAQEPIEVFYENKSVGNFIADIVIEENVIVELKAVSKLNKKHEVQLVNYLTATKIDVGLLINFGTENIEIKRKVRKLWD